MKTLKIDYISDLHLGFYLPMNREYLFNKDDVITFVKQTIAKKYSGDILVLAGDINEIPENIVMFINECKKYYKKIFFVAGNHEYYMLDKIEFVKYFNSLEKINYLIDAFKEDEQVDFLDRNNTNNGLVTYEGFTFAGDTLWYLPKEDTGWDFYMRTSNDSRLIIVPEASSRQEMILKLNQESIDWYNSLPENVDLIITHIAPIHNPYSPYPPNTCYFSEVKEIKTKNWIYGHDHVEANFERFGTKFLSNPWGYNSKTFNIKTLELNKREEDLMIKPSKNLGR